MLTMQYQFCKMSIIIYLFFYIYIISSLRIYTKESYLWFSLGSRISGYFILFLPLCISVYCNLCIKISHYWRSCFYLNHTKSRGIQDWTLTSSSERKWLSTWHHRGKEWLAKMTVLVHQKNERSLRKNNMHGNTHTKFDIIQSENTSKRQIRKEHGYVNQQFTKWKDQQETQ